MAAITRLKINFLDPYEWEDDEMERMAKAEKEEKEKEEKEKKEKENKENELSADSMKTAIPAKSAKAESEVAGEVDEQKKVKDNSSGEQQQDTLNVDKGNKLISAKDMASSRSEVNENSQYGTPAKAGNCEWIFFPTEIDIYTCFSAVTGDSIDMETAIECDQMEYNSKKALPSENFMFITSKWAKMNEIC